MLNAIIIDSDILHSKKICDLMHDVSPKYIIYETTSIEKITSLLSSVPISLIITETTYLDAIEKAEKIFTNLKIIAFGRTASFELARFSMNHGATDYLLKPIKKEDFKETIKKIDQAIISDFHCKDKAMSTIYSTWPVFIKHCFNQLILGQSLYDELQEIKVILPQKNKILIVICKFENIFETYKELSSTDAINYQMHLNQMTKVALHSLGSSVSFFLHTTEDEQVTIVTSDDFDVDMTDSAIKKIIETYRQSGEYIDNINIGVSYVMDFLPKNIQKAYSQSLLALRYTFYEENSCVKKFDEIEPFLNKMPSSFTYRTTSKNTNYKNIHDYLSEYLNNLSVNSMVNPTVLKEFLVSELNLLFDKHHRIGKEEEFNKIRLTYQEKIRSSPNFNLFKDDVLNFVTAFEQLMTENSRHKNNTIVSYCLDYIDQHYSEDISLETIATKLSFNVNYFSNFFKTNVGVGFVDYLQQVRMEKAKELLSQSKYKVYEVSKLCGYKDPKYFTRVFKKQFALSPDEYKRQCNLGTDK